MNEILDFINQRIKDEHGTLVTIDSLWTDANIDSFGSTMVLCDMDEKYDCFNREWLSTVNFQELTIKDLVERALNESIKL